MLHIIHSFWFWLKGSFINILKSLISSFGILFLISFLVLYISFKDSVKNYIETRLFGKLAINEIKIFPQGAKKTQLFATASIIRGNINSWQVKKIWSLKGLSDVQSVIMLDYEVKVEGSLDNQKRRVHMPFYGVDRSLFRGRDSKWQGFVNQSPVPVVAPKFLFELLNNFLYATKGLSASPDMFRDFPGKLKIYTEPKSDDMDKNEFNFDARLHSFTDVFAFAGLIVPKDFIIQFANKHSRDSGTYKKGYKHVMFFARVNDVKQLSAVSQELRKIGLVVESRQDITKKTDEAVSIIDDSSMVIIGILLVLTIISIFNSYLTIVYHRSQVFSLKRVLGVSKIGIIMNFVNEAAIVGLLYGIIGYFVGFALVDAFSDYAAKWMPALKNIVIYKPAKSLLGWSILFSMLISTVSALIPAIFASNINLFKAVRK